MIQWNDVSFSYGNKKVFEHLNIEYNRAPVLLITGESGCGKTTALRLLLGLETPKEGRIDTRGEHFSVVFQEDYLCEHMSAVDNCCLALQAMVSSKRKERYREVLELLRRLFPNQGTYEEFEEQMTKIPVSRFSKGMKRRVAIARALVAASTCLVMDEPLTGLDEDSQETVIQVIMDYRRDRRLIIATHNQKWLCQPEHYHVKLR